MSNELTVVENKEREISPEIWTMLNSIVKTTSGNSVMRQAVDAKKLLFAYENALNLNLAFNGGLYVTSNGRMEVEGIVIRSKLEVTKGYHLKIDRLDDNGCELSLWRLADNSWPVALYNSDAKEGDWVKYGQSSFTKDDAMQAGLLSSSKDTYKKYPADMFFNRATSRLYKRYLSSLFNGVPLYVRGEVGGIDFEDGEYVEVETAMTLADLQAKYTVDDILAANDGKVPSTEAEILAVDKKLSEANEQ